MYPARNLQSGFTGFGDDAPASSAALAYYKQGTPFLWLEPAADFGFAFSIDPGVDARAALEAYLRAHGYNVRVIYGQRGGPLEVSGTQNIDRNRATDIRDQVTQAAVDAGFYLKAPVQFNVESVVSSWRVGAPGSNTTWGDQTPVAPRSIFNELGLDLTGDTSLVGGSIKNLMIYGAVGLVVYALISRRR